MSDDQYEHFEFYGYVNEIVGVECLICSQDDPSIRQAVHLAYSGGTSASLKDFVLAVEQHLEDHHA